MRINAKKKIADYIDQILLGNVAVIYDGGIAKSIGWSLREMRGVGQLVIHRDPRMTQSWIFLLNPPSVVKRERKNLGGSIFNISFEERKYIKYIK